MAKVGDDDVKKKGRKRGAFGRFIDRLADLTIDGILDSMKINHATRLYWAVAVFGSLAITIIATVMDFTLPMEKGVFSMARAIIALAAGILYFMLAYSIAIYQSDARRRHYDDERKLEEVVEPYKEIRLRYSFRQRRRWSYPVIAVIIIIIAASWRSHMYVVFTGIALAMTFGIVAFVHPTPQETVLLVNDREDPRDLMAMADSMEHDRSRRERRRGGHGRRSRGGKSSGNGKKR